MRIKSLHHLFLKYMYFILLIGNKNGMAVPILHERILRPWLRAPGETEKKLVKRRKGVPQSLSR